MKLYTFQPLWVWEKLKTTGVYYPINLFDEDDFLRDEKSLPWGFLKSYVWLKEQMIQKGINSPKGSEHLIWAWYKWSGSQYRPDKRYASVYSFYNTPFVMMELEVQDNRVLLNDYDAWHYVLNYWYLNKPRKTDNFQKKYNYFKQKPLEDKCGHSIIEKSWEHIFDLSGVRKLLQYRKNQQVVQATFFELFLEDVKVVHYFDNNKCTFIEQVNKAVL